jgi:hypothetical protein
LAFHSRFSGSHAHEVKGAKKDPEENSSSGFVGYLTNALRFSRLRVGKVGCN